MKETQNNKVKQTSKIDWLKSEIEKRDKEIERLTGELAFKKETILELEQIERKRVDKSDFSVAAKLVNDPSYQIWISTGEMPQIWLAQRKCTDKENSKDKKKIVYDIDTPSGHIIGCHLE